MRLLLAMLLGRLAGRLSRLFGRGGSAIPGLVAERIDPRLVEKLLAAIPVVVVTGTNGKTTTSKMVTAILESAGRTVVANPTGSNLVRGIATRLIEVSNLRGRVDADVAVFEVDEAALRVLAPRVTPALVVVTNLARDQLDRFGELVTTAGHIRSALDHAGGAVLNADDGMVADLADDHSVHFVGAVDAIREAMPSDAALYGADDGHVPPTDLDVRLVAAEIDGDGVRMRVEADGASVGIRLRAPGVYNAYNAAMAIATARALGVELEACVSPLEAMPPAFGRGQVIDFRGRRVKLLLVKNPAGFNQAIRLLASAEGERQVLVAINDNHADGRDVSWLWDARVEELEPTDHHYGASGIRADDMALRFKYARIEAWADASLRSALDRVVDATPAGEELYVVPTYTAMLALLDLLLPDVSRREAWS